MARKIKMTEENRYDGPNDPKYDCYKDSLGEEYYVRPEEMKVYSK